MSCCELTYKVLHLAHFQRCSFFCDAHTSSSAPLVLTTGIPRSIAQNYRTETHLRHFSLRALTLMMMPLVQRMYFSFSGWKEVIILRALHVLQELYILHHKRCHAAQGLCSALDVCVYKSDAAERKGG